MWKMFPFDDVIMILCLQGKNMIGGAQLGDYKVSIGDGECSIYQLDGNTMLCHAPQSPPEDSISHRGPRVVVSGIRFD